STVQKVEWDAEIYNEIENELIAWRSLENADVVNARSVRFKKANHVRIYLPPDTNCLLSTINHCLTSTDKINLVIASKQQMPQWLSIDEADEHCRKGATIWRWACTDNGEAPDVVLAAAGVYPTNEVMAAAWILRQEWPDLR